MYCNEQTGSWIKPNHWKWTFLTPFNRFKLPFEKQNEVRSLEVKLRSGWTLDSQQQDAVVRSLNRSVKKDQTTNLRGAATQPPPPPPTEWKAPPGGFTVNTRDVSAQRSKVTRVLLRYKHTYCSVPHGAFLRWVSNSPAPLPQHLSEAAVCLGGLTATADAAEQLLLYLRTHSSGATDVVFLWTRRSDDFTARSVMRHKSGSLRDWRMWCCKGKKNQTEFVLNCNHWFCVICLHYWNVQPWWTVESHNHIFFFLLT